MKTEKGSALTSALISATVLSFVAMTALRQIENNRRQITINGFKSRMLNLRNNTMALLGNQNVWKKITEMNQSTVCLKNHSCQNGKTDPVTDPGAMDPQQLSSSRNDQWNKALEQVKTVRAAMQEEGELTSDVKFMLQNQNDLQKKDRVLPPNSTPPDPLAEKPSNLVLYDVSGNLLYDPLDPKSGFNFEGRPCKEFSPKGNDSCPLRMEVSWEPSCWNDRNPGSCRNPEEIIHLRFNYRPSSPAHQFPFNPANYDVSVPRLLLGTFTPIERCAQNQAFYAGNFPGYPNIALGTNVDAAGCIPLIALRGPAGPEGPRGPQGPTGPQGTTNGNTSAEAVIPPQATCTASSDVCKLYKKYLGRFPDEAGALYWQTAILDLQAQGKTYAEALAEVAMNISISTEYKTLRNQDVSAQELANFAVNSEAWASATGTSYKNSCSSGQANCTGMTSPISTTAFWNELDSP